MLFPPTDFSHMRQALAQAQQALFITSPNPRVGCVIVTSNGELIGQGHTQPAGQAHAEIMALRDAQSRGHCVTGGTAYVTLEPCAHHGRTGPCCDALIQAGIARVFASVQDPNPQVAGQGLARLRAAGIEVHTGLLECESRPGRHVANAQRRRVHSPPSRPCRAGLRQRADSACHHGRS